MSPDFQGLRILDSFLSSIDVNQFKDAEDNIAKVHIIPPQSYNLRENNLSCKICKFSNFDTLEEFKQHRQSEEHLNNLTESLSLNQTNEYDSKNEINESTKGSPFFEIIHDETKLQCYKALLVDRKDDNYSKSSLNLNLNMYNHLKQIQNTHIAIALNGGGYFASAIFDNSNKRLVCSKTFRRYTTRRKQGGSQSLKDNQKAGKINSAGSMIRRENEKKLQEEISNLFLAWKPHMEMCSLIFCNRDSLLVQEVFKNSCVRILPFTTYQADFEEICRCYTELISSIKILY